MYTDFYKFIYIRSSNMPLLKYECKKTRGDVYGGTVMKTPEQLKGIISRLLWE